MHLITEKIWAYKNGDRDPQRVDPSELRNDKSHGNILNNFSDLVSKVAIISFLNPRFFLLFRGQDRDYHTRKGLISLYPSIYRNEEIKRILPKNIQKKRFEKLNSKVSELRSGYPRHTQQFSKELRRLKAQIELCWAILQHYDIVKTPYLDTTASLRVAASFALLNSDSGYVFVFGVPYPTGTVTHVVDEDIKLVRLQAACPPSAKRPHFQEGFLVGSCYVDPEGTRYNHNLSRRLITKFHISDKKAFWEPRRFGPIPRDVLYPIDDKDFAWLK